MNDVGFMYAVICALAQGMQLIVMGVCLDRLLTGRDDRISKRKRLLIWTLGGMGIVIVKCLFPLPAVFIAVISPLALNLFSILFLKYCYSDKGWLKLLHLAMLIIQNILADVIQEILGKRPYIEPQYIPYRTRQMAEVCILIAAFSIMMHILYTIIVLRMRKKKQEKPGSVWIAIMLLFVLMFVAMRVMRDVWISDESVSSYFIFICLYTVLEFSMVMLYLSQSEKREAQEEKQAAQEEISKLQQVMELEKVHYEQIEARREEMAKIRHDYNNVITSVLFLMKNGETDEAEDVIMDLSQRIDETREYPFCAVPIINAILTEKQKTCEAEKIALTADLLIPERTGVADLDWCMIFGNLVDNAIRSCLEVRAQEKVCSITLNAGVVQEYLIVRCQNTSLENKEKKIKGSGYGHKILADIAAKYDGDFQTNCENGIFTAQISLKRA